MTLPEAVSGGASSREASPRSADTASPARNEREPATDEPYVVVHLVHAETLTPLIATQVVDHMTIQLAAGGPDRPADVVVGFIEPARRAMDAAVRSRLATLRHRAPALRIVSLPIVSRLGVRTNARFLAARLRRLARGREIVFHCRSESAVEWAAAMAPRLGGAGIVADIRGAWPEELLYARGFDGPADADDRSLAAYHYAYARLHDALAHAGAVIGVSRPMLDWLESAGVGARQLVHVPCCVSRIAWSADARVRVRAKLGVEDKRVFVYSGSITRYQHVEDGVLTFFRAVARHDPSAHLLCLSVQEAELQALVERSGIDRSRVTILSLPQAHVADHLCAGDAGLLLRAPSRMNRVSTPVKLGEYLASGLPVIVSRVPGWVDEVVDGAGAGLAVDWFGVGEARRDREARRAVAALAKDGERMRKAALRLCGSQFLWLQHVPAVRAAYRRARAVKAATRANK